MSSTKRKLAVGALALTLMAACLHGAGFRVVRLYDEDPDGIHAKHLALVAANGDTLTQFRYWSED